MIRYSIFIQSQTQKPFSEIVRPTPADNCNFFHSWHLSGSVVRHFLSPSLVGVVVVFRRPWAVKTARLLLHTKVCSYRRHVKKGISQLKAETTLTVNGV